MDETILEEEWLKRPILEYGKYKVPAYYEALVDGTNEFSYNYLKQPMPVDIYENIIRKKDKYKDKKIVDLGTGTGLGAILLKDAGLNVIGVERNRTNYIGAIYTMLLNDVYYDLVYSDQNYVKKIDYDVLILYGVFRCWEVVDTLVPIIRQESDRGKEVLFYTGKDPKKLLNFEQYRPENIEDPINTSTVELKYDENTQNR